MTPEPETAIAVLQLVLDEPRPEVTVDDTPTPSPDGVQKYHERLEEWARARQAAESTDSKHIFR